MADDNEKSSRGEDVPWSVRWRLAAGLRVPAQYREWALSRIAEEGWPARRVFASFVAMFAPVSIATFLMIMVLFDPGDWDALGYWAATGCPTYLIVGSLIAAYRPDYVRDRAAAYQVRERRKWKRRSTA